MVSRNILLAALGLLITAASALGQPAIVCLGNEALPLGCPCTNGEPYADGTATVAVVRDNGQTGPDSTDIQVASFAINGDANGLGQGRFVMDPCLTLDESEVPAPYYLQVRGGNCCWWTVDYTFVSGQQDVWTSATDWTCSDEPCSPIRWRLDVCYPNHTDTLKCPCTDGTRLPSGTPMRLFRDINGNGPDAADAVLDSFLIPNAWDRCSHYAIRAHETFDFYVEGGTSCCWRSWVHTASEESSFVMTSPEEWSCADQLCHATHEPTPAPANFRASDDSLCLRVYFSWEYEGNNLTGFNIYRASDSSNVTRVSPDARNAVLQVGGPWPVDYFIRANGAGGTSGPSNVDAGSPFLLHFAADSTGDIQGTQPGGSEFTLHFASEGAIPGGCEMTDSLFLLSADATVALLAVATNVGQITGHFPDTTLTDCRVQLVASYLADGRGFSSTETTASLFNLVALSAENRRPPVPLTTEIASVYPNPFNPETRIQFTLSTSDVIRLAVYNLEGRRVKTLVSGVYAAGAHTVVWDGKTDANTPAGTGIYFCRLTTTRTVNTKRLLLLK